LSKGRPQPTVLAHLFRLKYQEKIVDKNVLAEKLNINKKLLYAYESRLKRKLLSKINQITEERLELICPECLAARVFQDLESGEKVCTNCGYVVDEQPDMVHRLPFDETFAIENPLVFNGSQGSVLSRRALFTILAKAHNGSAEIPIHQIRTIATTFDPPLTHKMKEYAEALRKNARMDTSNPVCNPDIFSVALGNMVEKVGNIARFDPDMKRSPKDLAAACFVKTLEKMNAHIVIEGVPEIESVPEYALRFVDFALQISGKHRR